MESSNFSDLNDILDQSGDNQYQANASQYQINPINPIKTQKPISKTGWSKLSHNSHVAIIISICLFVLLSVGIVLAVIFTRPAKAVPTITPTSTVTPTVTVSPSVVTTFLLKDNTGQCYEMPKLNAQLNSPTNCNGVWLANETLTTLAFDGLDYEYCVEFPVSLSQKVYGVTGRGCNGVTLQNNQIRATNALGTGIDMCVNTNLLWSSCAEALTFTVENVNHTLSRHGI
jgi:hypothetical protein